MGRTIETLERLEIATCRLLQSAALALSPARARRSSALIRDLWLPMDAESWAFWVERVEAYPTSIEVATVVATLVTSSKVTLPSDLAVRINAEAGRARTARRVARARALLLAVAESGHLVALDGDALMWLAEQTAKTGSETMAKDLVMRWLDARHFEIGGCRPPVVDPRILEVRRTGNFGRGNDPSTVEQEGADPWTSALERRARTSRSVRA